MNERAVFSGSGPGARTRDGCSVALYEQSPYLDELQDCGLTLGPASSVLELGCGAGRLTRPMLESGALVTAVDNSEAMLRAVPVAAQTVLSDIESLHLGRTFETVLLASGLINHPELDARRAFVDCARRHLSIGGSFLLQRQDPDWLRNAEAGDSGRTGAVMIHVEAVSRAFPLISMTLRYQLGDDVWRQSFSVVSLSDMELESLLSAAGFDGFEWRGHKRRWLRAIATDLAGSSR